MSVQHFCRAMSGGGAILMLFAALLLVACTLTGAAEIGALNPDPAYTAQCDKYLRDAAATHRTVGALEFVGDIQNVQATAVCARSMAHANATKGDLHQWLTN